MTLHFTKPFSFLKQLFIKMPLKKSVLRQMTFRTELINRFSLIFSFSEFCFQPVLSSQLSQKPGKNALDHESDWILRHGAVFPDPRPVSRVRILSYRICKTGICSIYTTNDFTFQIIPSKPHGATGQYLLPLELAPDDRRGAIAVLQPRTFQHSVLSNR